MFSSFSVRLILYSCLLLLEVHAGSSQGWNSAEVCSDTTGAAFCLAEDTLLDWRVALDCTEPNSVTTEYTDERGEIAMRGDMQLQLVEVRLECHDDNQAEKSCQIPGDHRAENDLVGGPYIFSNLDAAGILPGWTCSASTCLSKNDGEVIYLRTEVANCTLPSADLVTTTTASNIPDPATTTIEMHIVEASTTEKDTVSHYSSDNNGIGETTSTTMSRIFTDDVIMGQVSELNGHMLLIALAVLTIPIFTAVIGAIVFIRKRQQRTRKIALMVYHKQNMIFDPDFYPAVDFDQHDIVSRGMSISSLNMLQSLRPQRQMNVYVEEGQVIEEKASLQKSKQLEDSNGSDDSKSSISVVLGLIPYDNNDAHHSQSEVVEDHVSLHFENIIDEVSSVYMDSDASSERSYKVQSSDNHETMPGAKSESLSGDNTSVATEVMCDEGQTGDDDHSISLHNDKVHPSNEYMPSNAFCTPDIPVDFEGTPTFNEFDLDVTLNDEHYNNHNKLSSNLATYDQELCQRPFSGEDDATLCHACKIEDPLSTLTNSYIILHPPVETALVQDVDCLEALDYLSAMPLPNEEGYSHCSTATSVSSTSSPVKTDINLDTSLHNCCSDADPRGYIPSEALTRKILVPGGLASPLKLDSGFTVHLDFDDGRKLSPIVQVYPESDLA